MHQQKLTVSSLLFPDLFSKRETKIPSFKGYKWMCSVLVRNGRGSPESLKISNNRIIELFHASKKTHYVNFSVSLWFGGLGVALYSENRQNTNEK